MDLMNAMHVSSQGMRAQGTRIRVIAQNVANAETLPTNPNEDPYKRKTITFANQMDKGRGVETVYVKEVGESKADFKLKFMPDHPAADENGYVKTPNVNTIIEMMDMREAQRSYEANLGLVEIAKGMMSKTLDLLRG